MYDQKREGARVGYTPSWTMSILNRRYYDARWLWNEVKELDEWPETTPDDNYGTSVRARYGRAAYPWTRPYLARRGQTCLRRGDLETIGAGHAVCIYRASDRLRAVGIVNSWGQRYPRVLMPYPVLERLLQK